MENSRIFKTMRSRDGFIGGVHTPVALGQQGGCTPLLALVNRGPKKSNSEVWHNFQGFSFFEVILKLII
jgi:hypothetical protein